MVDAIIARRFIEYNEASGVMVWKIRLPQDFCKNDLIRGMKRANQWNAKYAGKEAGTANHKKGYKMIGLCGKVYLSHRVAWLITFGEWPEHIDHINGVKTDNRIANLRSVNNLVNHKNMRFSAANRGSQLGVSFHAQFGKWRARIGDEHLGLFDDYDDAVKARKIAERERGYHPMHGIISPE